MRKFTHLDTNSGKAKMVDVGKKKISKRDAVAEGEIILGPDTIKMVQKNLLKKGDALSVGRIAGIMAAKKTGQLIPLCHSLNLDWMDIDFELKKDRIKITAIARIEAKTGVEMEALTGVAVAALTIYDMCKSVDKNMVIGDIRLVRKTKRRLI